MNHIDKIRAEIKDHFSKDTFSIIDTETSVSPTNRFRLTATNYAPQQSNWELTKVELFNNSTQEKLFDFFTNEGRFFYSWLEKDGREYFICAEDLFGGQTIIDLSNKEMASYSPGEDGFIWTELHLSPAGNILATIGCYWACPAVIKLFDFSTPMFLPLKEIKEIDLIANDETITGWIDNETFATKGFSRTYERTINGDFTGKLLSEIPVERHLKTDGIEKNIIYKSDV